MPQLDSVEASLALSFKNQELLRLALVHSSFLNENPGAFQESNERLEFLGDSLIGLAVAEEVFQRHPDRPEGELTTLRAELVNGETLGRVADSLHLGQLLLMGKGEEASGGRERSSNLAAALEALVGALFLDQGYEAARGFVVRALGTELSASDECRVSRNPKSALQELVQGRSGATPSYRTIQVTGEDHQRQYTVEVLVSGKVLGRGTGHRKSQAEQEAAREALLALDNEV